MHAGYLYTNFSAGFSSYKACGHTFDNVFNSVELQKGTVHLDIWYDNMSITDDGEITLFDFDNCGYGWLILDIGYYCMQLYHIETDKRIYEEKKRSFLEGYRSITDITDDEVRLLPQAGAAIWIYYLGIHAERFDTFSNNFLSANFVKMFIGKMICN